MIKGSFSSTPRIETNKEDHQREITNYELKNTKYQRTEKLRNETNWKHITEQMKITNWKTQRMKTQKNWKTTNWQTIPKELKSHFAPKQYSGLSDIRNLDQYHSAKQGLHRQRMSSTEVRNECAHESWMHTHASQHNDIGRRRDEGSRIL